MSFFGKLFGQAPAPLPVDEVQEIATETMEIDFRETLPAAWATFVDTFVAGYDAPSLVQSQGPGRVTSFPSLSEDEGGPNVSRLTADDVMREFETEWRTQLHIPPTPRTLIAELHQAEGWARPFVLFLYPQLSELTPDFSTWASNRAQLDAKRDRANSGTAPQGAVIFAKLTGADAGQDGAVWMNELARQKVAAKAQQLDGDGARVAEEVEEIAPETAKTPRKKPSNPLQR